MCDRVGFWLDYFVMYVNKILYFLGMVLGFKIIFWESVIICFDIFFNNGVFFGFNLKKKRLLKIFIE